MPTLMPRVNARALSPRAFWHPQIELRSIRKLRPAKRNARTHTKKQLEKLIGIIRRFGFINPIIIDQSGTIIAGHLRWEAGKQLGMLQVPVIRIDHLSDVEKRTFALAENRISLDSGWDREVLAMDLGELAVLLPEANIELADTAFDVAEIDLIIGDRAEAPEGRPEGDELPEPGPPISRVGDLWVMARHRLHAGDARDPAAYATLMRGDTAEMVFTDPPFNFSVRQARGRSKDRFDEFVMASGEMSNDEYQNFLDRVLRGISDACADGSIVYVCIDWRHIQQLLAAGAVIFDQLKNICVWIKSNAGQGSFYRNQHEMVCVFKKGKGRHINSFELGQHGRSRSNTWNYAGVNAFKVGREDELNWHPTVKPVRLVADAMLDCSQRGSIILDPFLGSGTTIVAAETVGRRAFGMELDPRYVDVAIRRWQQFTGRDAVLEATGQTFGEIEAARLAESTSTSLERRASKRRR